MANKKSTVRPAKSARQALSKVAAKAGARFKAHRQLSPHRSFRLTRHTEVPHYKPIPSWWRLAGRTVRLLWRMRQIVGALLLIYIVINWVLIGLTTVKNFESFKQLADSLIIDFFGGLQELFLLAGTAVTSVNDQTVATQVMVGIIGLLFWLGYIWLARHAIADKRTTLRETLYLSGTSLVPTALVFLLGAMQTLPGLMGVTALAAVMQGGWEDGTMAMASMFVVLAALLILLSVYFLVSTFVALQIVALPGMYPWRALQDARVIIAGRRFSVMRKVLILPVLALFWWLVTIVPALLLDNIICADVDGGSCWSTPLFLPTLNFLVSALLIAFVSVYAYLLYRSLLETRDT
ncbi:hypothetical protein JNJ66_02445 [Candidatus Saccharibacteria bacterium]|nr:hypothetical protein [Candidatus Saccharibacteria bacterium]